jgi:GNAT superfamily N-acetyltransferase
MQIRAARASDVPQIVAIWKDFIEFHRKLDESFALRKGASVRFGDYLRELVSQTDCQLLVADEGSTVLAYSIAFIRPYPPVFVHDCFGLISDLAVIKERWRMGIGSQVLARVFDWFRANQVDQVELRVAFANTVGAAFWSKHGFREYMRVLRQELRPE